MQRDTSPGYCEYMRTGLGIIVVLVFGCRESASPPVAPSTTPNGPRSERALVRSISGPRSERALVRSISGPHPVHTVPAAGTVDAAPATPHRCLPVVSQECGCVYTCGVGVQMGNGPTWNVSHGFWPGIPLTARVVAWCVAGSCTDAFAAELVCGGICAPKPADATCHFDAHGACVGAAS